MPTLVKEGPMLLGCCLVCDMDRTSETVPCYTLKLRGGADTYMKENGDVGTAGKGPLIQVNISATLGATQDQYLFVPVKRVDR